MKDGGIVGGGGESDDKTLISHICTVIAQKYIRTGFHFVFSSGIWSCNVAFEQLS